MWGEGCGEGETDACRTLNESGVVVEYQRAVVVFSVTAEAGDTMSSLAKTPEVFEPFDGFVFEDFFAGGLEKAVVDVGDTGCAVAEGGVEECDVLGRIL